MPPPLAGVDEGGVYTEWARIAFDEHDVVSCVVTSRDSKEEQAACQPHLDEAFERHVATLRTRAFKGDAQAAIELARRDIGDRCQLPEGQRVSNMAFHYLDRIMDELVGDVYMNMVLSSLLEVPFILLTMLALSRLGRRRPLLAAYLLMATTSLASIAMESVPGRQLSKN